MLLAQVDTTPSPTAPDVDRIGTLDQYVVDGVQGWHLLLGMVVAVVLVCSIIIAIRLLLLRRRLYR